MKQVYLYVGPPKTGSTSIQSTLEINKVKLLQNGVLYANSGRIKEGEVYMVHRSGGLYPEKGLSNCHQTLAWVLEDKVKGLHKETVWNELSKELKNTDAQKIIISGEAFFIYQNHLYDISKHL